MSKHIRSRRGSARPWKGLWSLLRSRPLCSSNEVMSWWQPHTVGPWQKTAGKYDNLAHVALNFRRRCPCFGTQKGFWLIWAPVMEACTRLSTDCSWQPYRMFTFSFARDRLRVLQRKARMSCAYGSSVMNLSFGYGNILASLQTFTCQYLALEAYLANPQFSRKYATAVDRQWIQGQQGQRSLQFW